MTDSPTRLAVSVVIPTHNPRRDYLARVIEALRQQTLSKDRWEVVVVDNGSREALEVASRQTSVVSEKANCVDLIWHPNARVVREEMLGLTFARLRGFAEAKGELIVMVDDDNLLAPGYLATAVEIAQERPMLGAFGGRCLPEFEHEPPEWLKGITSGLGVRDLGEKPVVYPCEGEKVGKYEGESGGLQDQETKRPRGEETAGSLQMAVGSWQGGENGKTPTERRQRRAVREFPDCAPIGAGMVLRREAARAYAERLDQKTKRRKDQETITDRKGNSLASGGDNDICLTVIEEGWQVGYLSQLQLTHLIPRQRMTLDYQQRMAREAMRSFVLMLDQHGVRPWVAIPGWTVPLRVAKDYLRVRPWKSPERLLRWNMNRGQYEACGRLAAKQS
jgi:hypothetical protein